MFAAMPRGVVDAIAAGAVRRRIRKGRPIGEPFVLVTGRVEVTAGEVVRSLVPPTVANVSVAAGGTPTAELVAAEDCEIVALPALAAVLRRHPDAMLAALVQLGRTIGELSEELAALRQHGLAARIRHRLAQLGAGRREVAITHGRLAEEVGGTRANVSRALARLEREGSLRRRRGRIELTQG